VAAAAWRNGSVSASKSLWHGVSMAERQHHQLCISAAAAAKRNSVNQHGVAYLASKK